jgi:hypothetical protein
MSDHLDFVMDCVVSVVSDDYESFEIIFEQISCLAGLKRLTITEDDVAKAIECAIEKGFVEAYELSPQEPHSLKAKYSPKRLHQLWFYVTPCGKGIAKSMAELGADESTQQQSQI